MKKLLIGTFAAALLLSAAPAALAANDLEGNWAKAYIEYLSQIPYNNETGGVIRPNSTTGKYDPDKQVTRAEFMRYINRAFNFTEKAPVSQFTDLSANGWYMDTVQIAAKHGYISGINATSMAPNEPITREQVISVLGRLFKKDLEAVDPETLNFTDNRDIGKWSAAYIKDAVDAGIVRGYVDGSFKPTAAVTRAEVASLLYHYMGSSLNKEGEIYTSAAMKADTRNVTISAACTLQNAVIPGDLYITEGVTGSVTLSNVTIRGDLIQSGGNLVCNAVTASRMILDSPMGRLMETTVGGGTEIQTAELRSAASLLEKGLTGAGFISVILSGDSTPSLTLDGSADVTATRKSTIATTAAAVIGTLTANAPVTVTGYGSIRSAAINAQDCSLAMTPLDGYSIKGGFTATIEGKEASGTQAGPEAIAETPITPATSATATTATTAAAAAANGSIDTGVPVNSINLLTATFDRNPESDAYQDLTVGLFAVDDAIFRKVVLGGVEVNATFSRSTITIDADDLAEIYPGTYTLTYVMSTGENPTLKLTIIDTGSSAAVYDYETEWSGSSGSDVEFRTDRDDFYSSSTGVSSIKYNGNNFSSQKFDWELTSNNRLTITMDGSEINRWFADYHYPPFLDFDVKLIDPSETFTVRIWYGKYGL